MPPIGPANPCTAPNPALARDKPLSKLASESSARASKLPPSPKALSKDPDTRQNTREESHDSRHEVHHCEGRREGTSYNTHEDASQSTSESTSENTCKNACKNGSKVQVEVRGERYQSSAAES